MRLRDDSGIAMVTAILVMLIVSFMGATAYTLSSHSLDQSGQDKSRTQAIHAAEAGINRVFLYLDQTAASSVACNPIPGTQTLPSSPQEQYQVTVTYYDAADSPIATCPPAGAQSVLIRSTGSVTGTTPQRTMEALVRLATPSGGSFGNGPIYSNSTATVRGGGTINGNPDNADIYARGNLRIEGGTVVNGAVYTAGTLLVAGGSQIKRDAHALGSITLNGATTTIFGSANSSTGTIGSSGQVRGDANSCGMIAVSTVVLGARRPSACPPAPPIAPFQTYTYDRAAWESPPSNYEVHDFTGSNACTDARSFIRTAPTGNNVVRIQAPCKLVMNGEPKAINVNGNLAIIGDYGLTVEGGNYFTSGDGNTHSLHLIFDLLGACADPNSNVRLAGGNYTDLDTLVYTPCRVTNEGGSSYNANGQIYAGQVDMGGGVNLNYTGLTVPGLSTGSYRQDIAYIREIVN